VLAKLQRDSDRLDALKPTKVKNDVAKTFTQGKNSLELQQTHFNTRMRVSAGQVRYFSCIIDTELIDYTAHRCRV
jgi:hypothetical protein